MEVASPTWGSYLWKLGKYPGEVPWGSTLGKYPGEVAFPPWGSIGPIDTRYLCYVSLLALIIILLLPLLLIRYPTFGPRWEAPQAYTSVLAKLALTGQGMRRREGWADLERTDPNRSRP